MNTIERSMPARLTDQADTNRPQETTSFPSENSNQNNPESNTDKSPAEQALAQFGEMDLEPGESARTNVDGKTYEFTASDDGKTGTMTEIIQVKNADGELEEAELSLNGGEIPMFGSAEEATQAIESGDLISNLLPGQTIMLLIDGEPYELTRGPDIEDTKHLDEDDRPDALQGKEEGTVFTLTPLDNPEEQEVFVINLDEVDGTGNEEA